MNDVCIDDYGALAIPGGFEEYGFYEDAFSDQAVELIKEFNDRDKMIATICVAALALGNNGILKGKRATTYHLNNGHRQKQLAEYGAIVVNEPVVRSDNIITSYCPQTGPAVAFMLLEELLGTDKMQETKTAMGFLQMYALIARIPYAATVAFLLLLIKGIMLFKVPKS